MSHKVLFHAALIVLAFAVLLTGCRRSTPIIDPPPPEPPGPEVPEEPVDPEPPEVLDTAPSFAPGLETLQYSYPVGVEILHRILPEAAGGDGPLTYTLGEGDEVLPPGMAYVESQRVLMGTPQVEGDYELTYRAVDADDNLDPSDSAVLKVAISVGPAIPVSALLAAVNVGETEGVLIAAAPPQANGGPSVEPAGNHVLVSGGAIFVDVAADDVLDKLLLSVDMQSYYEIDLAGAMAPYRFVGHVMPGIEEYSPLCLSVMGVAADGTVGEPECHPLFVVPGIGTGDLEIAVSWDNDADLDLHVVDPNGDEIYWGRDEVDSGGVLDLESGTGCRPDGRRTEHIAWTGGTPPPGKYVIRVNYWSDCGGPEPNYVVNVTLNGERTSFYGMFEGPGEEDGGRGSGELIDIFEIPGDAPPPPVSPAITHDYRGSGDQVFVLNPEGEILDDTLVTLNLGETPAEVYVIASNTAHYPMEPRVERLDIMEAAIKAGRFAHREEYQAQPRSAPSEFATERHEVTEFNNSQPQTGGGTGKGGSRLLQQSAPPPVEGDTFIFLDLDFATLSAIEIPATARRVITDGATTVALWVADADWETACDLGVDAGGGQLRAAHIVGVERACVTAEMVDALATRFLQPGSGNDIYDWVTSIFGDPWGPYHLPAPFPRLPAEAGDEIHILLFDIAGDGVPSPGQARIVGFFFAKDNFLRNPDHPVLATSNERLMFYLDAPWFTVPDGPTWEISDRRPSVMVGTLAHEFQHMIHYYQKPVLRGAASETWLNEMASEVAEDLVADKMRGDGPRSVDYDDPTAGEPENHGGRLPGFNLYNDLQVTRWDGLTLPITPSSTRWARTWPAPTVARRCSVPSCRATRPASTRSTAALNGRWATTSSFGQVAGGLGRPRWCCRTTPTRFGPLPLQHQATWRYLPQRRRGVPAGLDQPVQLRAGRTRGADGPISRLEIGGACTCTRWKASARPRWSRTPTSYVFLGRNSGTIRLNVSAVTDNRITVVVKE